jgi:hypothetical protein
MSAALEPIASSVPGQPPVEAEVLAGGGLGLLAAARKFPSYRNGRPVSASTIFRWISAGVRLSDGRRIRLEACRVGGRWLTSEAALARFVAAQRPPEPLARETPSMRSPRQTRAAGARAAAELARRGI